MDEYKIGGCMNTINNMPIISETDYVILGGGLKEVAAGICLAKKHNRVLLLTKETYLLDDLCCSNMYLAQFPEDAQNPLLKQLFPESVYRRKKTNDEKWLLHPDKIKRNVEEVCDQYEIKFLYNVSPLDIFINEEQKYLRIGGKFGVCGIACKSVIDLHIDENIVLKNRYFMHVQSLPSIEKEERIMVIGEKESYEVSLFPGVFNFDHGILQIPCEETLFPSKAEYHIACRQKCLEAFQWLKCNREEYKDIKPGRFSADGYSASYDYLKEIHMGLNLAENIQKYSIYPNHMEDFKWKHLHSVNDPFMEELEIVAFNTEIEDRNYKTILAPCFQQNKQCNYDIIVVGGGTAGAMAALHASRNGLQTLLLEMNQDLGGTGTVGGVSTYWFGKRFKSVMEVDHEIQKIYDWLSLERSPGIWSSYDDCNPGIKSMVLTELCIDAGVTIIYPSISFGVIKDKTTGRVAGVTTATEEGILYCFGKYVVDATGDGDIASFAGADAVYGSSRDNITYWGSLAQYISPAKYRNNFSSTLMVSDPLDYTRFIRLGRCRGDDTFDHGTYVSPRESRHIKGRYEINLKDILCFHTYEDGIYTCFSNYDPKGKLSADMVYAGVLPPQVSIQIPMRALLPVDTNGTDILGIIVAGKAISCTHNAFPSIRMQPDLMHQGTVIGRILAEAVHSATELTMLNGARIKKIISSYTDDPLTLTKITMTLEEIVKNVTFKDRSHWVDFPFTEEVKKEERSVRIMSADSLLIAPLLEQKYIELSKQDNKKADSETESNIVMLAGYLLWHGSDIGTETLLKSITKDLFATEGLPMRQASTMCAQLLPDHGVMPEVVYKMNLLAWSKEEMNMEPFVIVLNRLLNMERDYVDIKQGIYHYIEVFPYVAERTGAKAFIPLLLQLLEFEEFKQVIQTENKAAMLTERLLILLLSIYRALARCGVRRGYEGLIGMLTIESLPIAASACRELETLMVKEYGLDVLKWEELLEHQKKPLEIQKIEEKVW